MKTTSFLIGLLFICFTENTTEGFEEAVRSECRDRYLWIHVASKQTPRFEAVDGNGVHAIDEQLASRCGYTISTFRMDGFTTFRASYYSCFTHNQDDEVFTFRFNVMVSDAGGRWSSQPVSAECGGLSWTHREVVCEEDYMEVNVNRESSCGAQRGGSGQVWQAAVSQAQRTASSFWQLMILQSDGQVSSMSIAEAGRRGYSLTTSARRVVLRSLYRQPQAELTMVEGVPVEVVRLSLFFKQKLMVVMIDVSVACPVNSGSFDGSHLIWKVPHIVAPLVGVGAKFESLSLRLGVEGVLLNKSTTAARGFSLVPQDHLIQIGVPFGAEGGYRKSLVVNNVYKETYVIFLLLEHIFSLLYEDGSSVETRHRMLRVLDTPLLCRSPFSLDQTMTDDQVFRVYLGNIPADVILEEVWINGKQLMMSQGTERRYTIRPVTHSNGSRAYELQLPFEDPMVHRTYLGQGVVQYSIDVNFTLTITPQRDSYHHHTVVTAHGFNTFPPEITAQCSEGGITFSVVTPHPAQSLWEVGVSQEPLTPQLAAQRGYHLHTDPQRTSLEVPLFSVGYSYEDINLSNFYGIFKLLLRDSKTLEVQTTTTKRCLFRTQDLIVCSADGTMMVVTTPAATWPTVQPERTTLLDPACGPNQTDGSRVLFQFKLDSCGTRAMVGESYVVYENEVLHDRQMIADGPNFISRESQFKLTVRCFYPLSGVNRLSVDRIYTSGTPGFGSVKVFKSVTDTGNKLPSQDCLQQVNDNARNTLTTQFHQTPAGLRPQPKPGSSHVITGQQGVDRPALDRSPSTTSPEPLFAGQWQTGSGGSSHTPHSEGGNTWLVGLTRDQVPPGQSGSTKPNQGLQSLNINTSPTMEEGSQQLETNLDLSLYGSSAGGMEMDKTEEVPWYQQQGRHDPSQTFQLHQVLKPPAQVWPDHTGSSELHRLNRDKAYIPANANHIPANANHIPSGNTVSHWSVSPEPTSAATSYIIQSLQRPGSVERRNTEMVQSRVRNVRVKPLSRFVSSGLRLSQKPSVQPAAADPGPHPTETTVQQPIRIKESASTWRNNIQPAESHIRVSPGPDGPGQNHIRQGDTNTDVKQHPQNPTRVLEPTTGGAAFTGPKGGSDLNLHTTSDCRGQYGASVHRGILRGTRWS